MEDINLVQFGSCSDKRMQCYRHCANHQSVNAKNRTREANRSIAHLAQFSRPGSHSVEPNALKTDTLSDKYLNAPPAAKAFATRFVVSESNMNPKRWNFSTQYSFGCSFT